MNRTTRTSPRALLAALAAAALAAAPQAHAAEPGPASTKAEPAAAAASAPPARASGAGALAKASAPTRQALATLLEALPEGDEGAPRQRVTARRGETLDGVIRRTMGDSPFKEAFLRGVFLELNAGAFHTGTTRLLPESTLFVPNTADLRGHLQRVLGVPSPAQQAASASAAAAPAQRRAWVRFP